MPVFANQRTLVGELAANLEQVEENKDEENPNLQSDGSLRSPGMPLPPLL